MRVIRRASGDVGSEAVTTYASWDMMSLVDVPVRYDLAQSTCPPLRVGDLLDQDEVVATGLGYGRSQGGAELRALIAAEAGIEAEHVLVTVGAVSAMFMLAQDRCGPGDHVVLATPCFPPARIVPEGLGARVEAVPLRFEDGYRLPVAALAESFTASTRLVSLASPQNPSGVSFTAEELQELLTVVSDRSPEAVVLVDETYRASAYHQDAPARSAAALSGQVVTCSSVSKAHGAPGLRIGWLTTTDPGLHQRLSNTKSVLTSSCSTVDEVLAAALLRRRAEILSPRAQRLGAALDELERWVEEHPVAHVRPDAGAVCCVRLDPDVVPDGTVGAFYEALADRDVRVAPGRWFGEDERVFRVGFGHLAPADFTEALSRVGDALLAHT